jgi:hypothetical protein
LTINSNPILERLPKGLDTIRRDVELILEHHESMIKVQITISQGMTNGFQMKKTHTVTLYGHDFKTQTVNSMKKRRGSRF